MAASALEAEFARQLALTGLDADCRREYRFEPRRRWRLDFAWPDDRLAVEVEGGIFMRGRHTRGAGFEADCRKYNAAVLLGWRVLRVTGSMIESGEALAAVEALLHPTPPARAAPRCANTPE